MLGPIPLWVDRQLLAWSSRLTACQRSFHTSVNGSLGDQPGCSWTTALPRATLVAFRPSRQPQRQVQHDDSRCMAPAVFCFVRRVAATGVLWSVIALGPLLRAAVSRREPPSRERSRRHGWVRAWRPRGCTGHTAAGRAAALLGESRGARRAAHASRGCRLRRAIPHRRERRFPVAPAARRTERRLPSSRRRSGGRPSSQAAGRSKVLSQ